MRSNKEMAEEVLRRVEIINRQKTAKRKKTYSIAVVAACLVLIVGLSFAIPTIVTDFPAAEAEGMYNAAMLADALAGGYVLIGVIGFALGAAVTIFCVKGLGKKAPEEQPYDRDD